MIKQSISFFGIGPRFEMQDAGIFRKVSRKKIAWCVVCDGIGGQPGGAEAANICINEYDQFLFYSNAQKMVVKTVDFLKLGLLPVIDGFYNHVQKNQLHEQMGCTMALLYVDGYNATFGWCGDSRIYVFRYGKLLYKSLPHNPSFDAYRDGSITLRKAEKSKTNILTRAINVGDAFPIFEFKEQRLQLGDRILICTDGVWNKLEPTDFKILASSQNLKKSVKQIENNLRLFAEDNYWGWVGEIG